MANYAPNFTARLRVRYTTGVRAHSMLFRAASSTVLQSLDFVEGVQDFFAALASTMYSGWQVTGAEVADVNSDIFLPSTRVPATPGGKTAIAQPLRATPNALGFVGRTTGGHRVSLWVYGTNFEPTSTGAGNYRLTTAEEPVVSGGIGALMGLFSLGWRGPDDLPVAAVYPYANLSVNAYLQRRARV